MSLFARISAGSKRLWGGLAAGMMLAAFVAMVVPTAAFAWSTSGTISYNGETNTYLVSTVPGVSYSFFTVQGNIANQAVALHDPTLSIADGAASYYDDDSGGGINGLDAKITFTATTSMIQVTVRGYQNMYTGDYLVYGDPNNQNPSASGGSFGVNEDTWHSGSVGGSDPDGNALTFHLSSGPSQAGGFGLNSNGSFSYLPRSNYNGSDSFSYYVTDGMGGTSGVAWVSISVYAVPDPPVGVNDNFSTNEDTGFGGSVLGGDYDFDGGPITTYLNSSAGKGSVNLQANGNFSYTPYLNANGWDSFTYLPQEGGQWGNVTTVSIYINPINDVPTGNADSVTVTEDGSVAVPAATGVLSNDPADIEGSLVTASVWAAPTRGTVVIQPNGAYVYTPREDEFGADSFTYRGYDGTGYSAPITVNVTIVGTPDAPVSSADSYTTDEDTTLNVSTPGARGKGVLSNDIDVDLEPLTAILVTDVEHGELTLNSDGSFSYAPDANWFGTDSFEYNPYDGALHGITVVVTLNVTSVNDKPVGGADAYSTDEDTDLLIEEPGILANDSDPVEGSPVQVWWTTRDPAHGDLYLWMNGTIVYRPNADYHGADSFTYRISDGMDLSDEITVDLTVNSVNDAPVAADDSVTLAEDTSVSRDVEGGVLDNDNDVDRDELTVALVEGVSHGTLSLNEDGSYDYTPEENFFGTDSFTYRVNDGTVDSGIATVTINVTSVNDAPVAKADSASTDEDTELSVAAPGVLGNDSDPVENSALSAVLVDGVDNGTLSLKADGSYTYQPNANFFGSDSFSYKANDGSGDSDVVTVEITVNSVNDVPVGGADSASTLEDTQLSVNAPGVLGNDSDPVERSPLTAVLGDDVDHGTLTLGSNGNYTYMPDANFNGTDTFTYTANDGTDNSAAITVTITVVSVYDAPVAIEDTYECDEDGVLTLSAPGLLGNDLGDGPLTINAWHDSAEGTWGTVTAWADGRMRYTPPANFHGVDTFVYRIGDGLNRSAYVLVTINVLPVNDAPTALDDAGNVDEDGSAALAACGNDSDVDGDELTPVLLDGPANGSVEPGFDGSEPALVYTPDPDFFGEDTFTYRAFDGELYSEARTVTFNVISVNDAPVASDDSASTDEDTELVVGAGGILRGMVPGAYGVLGNDYDVDGDWLEAWLFEGTSHGDLQFNFDGSYTYMPHENFSGEDSFSYYAGDGDLNSELATVIITVNPVNDAPVAMGDSAATDEDKALVVDAARGVLANDSDVDSELSAVLVDGVSNGNLSLAGDGSYTYTPAENFFGEDSFTYKATDGESDSDVVTVDITVNSVNDAPVAVDDEGEIDEDGVLSVEAPGVLSNDTDVERDKLYAGTVDGPRNGTLDFSSDGSYTYTPEENFFGEDSFTYSVNDDDLDSNLATVIITVNPVNDTPVAKGDSAATNEDKAIVVDAETGILANDSDVEGPLSAVLVDDVLNGSLSLAADGSYSYTPKANFFGEDSFTYKATDGESDSDVVTVVITVNSVNDAPVAGDDSASVDEDGVLPVEAPGVLSNDTDVEEDKLFAWLVDGTRNGTLELLSDGSYTYTPNENFSGEDSFTYRATDDDLDSNLATVIITVNPVNDAPKAMDGLVATAEDTLLEVDAESGVLAECCTDADEDELTAELVGDVAHGELTFHADGSYTYAPDANFFGKDSFTFKANDGQSDSNVATMFISVKAVNDAPVATGASVVTDEDTLLSGEAPGVLAGDTDVDGDELTAELVGDVAHGELSFHADGSYTYMPDENFFGEDSFTYTANDGELDSEAVTVKITVNSFASATSIALSSPSATLAKYGDAFTVTGKLMAGSRPLAGRKVVLQVFRTTSGTFVNTPAFATTAADGSFSLKHVPTQRSTYRVSFTGDADHKATVSAQRWALPRSLVGNPVAPATMLVGQAKTVYGTLLPYHSEALKPVQIYLYRYVSGSWKSYGYVTCSAKNYVTGSGATITRYVGSVKFGSAGKWRMRAFHPSGPGHASSWSAGYSYVQVN